MKDKDTTVKELKDLVDKFVEERNWGQHHTPRNVAASIAIEAAELLEHFQWRDPAEESKKEVERELADVIIYCLSFASVSKIDLASAIEEKMERNAEKYPAEMFQNKEAELSNYYKAKKRARKK